MSHIVNRGTGAGGSATNISGLPFEDFVSNEDNLLKNGFDKVYFSKNKGKYYLMRRYDDDTPRTVYYAKKKAFKLLVKNLFGVEDMFKEPDEAYLIHWELDDTYDLKVVEVKNQNRDGSVEEKLWTAGWVKDVYREALNNNVNVSFAYTVSSFIKKKLDSNIRKYQILCNLYAREDIKVFHAQDDDYFKQLNAWIGID